MSVSVPLLAEAASFQAVPPPFVWQPGAGPRPYAEATDAPFEPFPDAALERPIFDRFASIAARFGAWLAIADGNESLSYGQVLDAALRIASHLRGAPDGPVGLLLPNRAWFPVAALGCLAAGRAFVPLDLHYPDARNAGIVARAGLRIVLLDDPAAAARLGLGPAVTCLGLADALRAPPHPATPAADPDAPAVILYTSGSTGLPKGIVNSARAILKRVQQGCNGMHAAPADRMLLLSSPCTIIGTREWLVPLLTGASLHPRDPQTSSLHALRAAMQAAGVTIMFAVPSFLRTLLAAADDRRPFAALRIVSIGGERVLWDDVALLRAHMPPGCVVRTGYQSTETPCCAWHPPASLAQQGAAVPVGYILEPEVDYAVIDEAGAAVPPGQPGALVLRSRYVALGEWHAGRLVPGAIRPDPDDPARRIVHTGDLVRFAPDGLMSVLGRVDQQVKIRGQRVELGELESLLRQHPGVMAAAVVPRPGAGGVTISAFVVPAGPAPGLPAALRAAIRAQLPAALLPAALHVVDALPKLPSGKLDLQALAAFAPAAAAPEPPGPGGMDTAIAAAWCQLFGRDSWQRDESWEAAGGDSLTLLTFVFLLEEALATPLPLDLFEARSTPSSLARRLPQAPAAGTGPALVFMPGLGGDQASLASLRGELRGRRRVVAVRYPDWAAMMAPGYGFDTLLDAVMPQLAALQTPDLVLAGYSFGGVVAFAAARRMRQAGRAPPAVLLLDANPRLEDAAGAGWRALATPGRPRELLRRAAWQAASWPLLRPGATPLAARLLRQLAPEWRRRLQSEMAQSRRKRLVRHWLRRQVWAEPVPVTLFRSQELRPGAPADLGWGAMARAVAIVPVAGRHESMLTPPHRAVLRDAIQDALRTLDAGCDQTGPK